MQEHALDLSNRAAIRAHATGDHTIGGRRARWYSLDNRPSKAKTNRGIADSHPRSRARAHHWPAVNTDFGVVIPLERITLDEFHSLCRSGDELQRSKLATPIQLSEFTSESSALSGGKMGWSREDVGRLRER